MPRSRGWGKEMGAVRADLEAVTLALVDCDEVMPEIILRINQAIRRTGLTSLLEPALDDLERMASDHREAKSMVGAAVSKLVSGCDDAST